MLDLLQLPQPPQRLAMGFPSHIIDFNSLYLIPNNLEVDNLFKESLFANGNASVRIYRPEKVAIIGRLQCDAIDACTIDHANFLCTDKSTGGGIAGAVIAHSFSDEHQGSPQVTIFERESRLGGRIHTVPSYDGSLNRGDRVETGGSTFDAEDFSALYWVAKDVGVEMIDAHHGQRPLALVSTWDGQKLIPSEVDQARPLCDSLPRVLWYSLQLWREFIDMFWSYGLDWITTWRVWRNSLIWKRSWPGLGPSKDLLHQLTSQWGGNHREEPDQRQRQVKGGMERFLKRMVKLSGSAVRLDSTVTRLTHEDLTFDVHWSHIRSDGTLEEKVERFDSVVITAPFHQANIKIEPPLPVIPPRISYKSIHVTHFISRQSLDPTTFNLSPKEILPDTIWSIGDRVDSLAPRFLTLSRQTTSYLDGCLVEDENLFRITSEHSFSDDEIAMLLNRTGHAREHVTFPGQSCYPIYKGFQESDPDSPIREELLNQYTQAVQSPERDRDDEWFRKNVGCEVNSPTVRWIHRQFWQNAVPIVDKNRASGEKDRIELSPRLFYVSGFEGREGASISGSVKSAKEASDRLFFNHIAPYRQ
ncbi:uncharacterized protein N7459_006424 [Penicillium hispanicum]|uniref:uncharacterized protein n=1 Tax=Penicillium hispanicum TaxID=1080232 RepID=UPI002540A917|nr:uncharacterized protein N7459_006424 [Penicillium hispanicum]KAJ5577460.1 hypothetical protein N7459_006424 [Penicillium hispanicum]